MNHQPPVICASGTHREVGRQIGEAARDLVAQGLAAYEERFPLLAGFSFAEAVQRSRAYLLPAEDHLPQAVDQIRGLAEGANAAFQHLFALNCCEEFTCTADRVWPRLEHCTSFAVVAAGRVVSGHNEDWYPEDVEGLVIRKVRLSGAGDWSGTSYISVGAAYDLPITGITSHGFTSAANTVYFRDERVGVPNNCLLTAVLEQPDLERVRDLIAGSPRARGSNHLLCDTAGRIWDIETTGSTGRSSTAPRSSRTRITTSRRSSRPATPPPPRAHRSAALAPRSCSRPASMRAPTWSSSARPCSATTPTRRSASARIWTRTIPTRTRA